jgi:hypothetical protein
MGTVCDKESALFEGIYNYTTLCLSRQKMDLQSLWVLSILVETVEKEFEQQQDEYNIPQTWCVFHRPPPVRDVSIHTPSRLFCKVQPVPEPTSCYT